MAKSFSGGRKMATRVKLGFNIDGLILYFCFENLQWAKITSLKIKLIIATEPVATAKWLP